MKHVLNIFSALVSKHQQSFEEIDPLMFINFLTRSCIICCYFSSDSDVSDIAETSDFQSLDISDRTGRQHGDSQVSLLMGSGHSAPVPSRPDSTSGKATPRAFARKAIEQ